MTKAITHLKRADLVLTPFNSSRSLRQLSSSVPPSPAYRALKTPGAPPKASTSRPESSESAAMPVAEATKRALAIAFSLNVEPVSGGSSRVGYASRESTSRLSDASISSISLTLDLFLVASISFIYSAGI